MALEPRPRGAFTAAHLKTLRLLFSDHPPASLAKVAGLDGLLDDTAPLVRTMLQTQGLANS
jgi:hypothetical protein